MGGYKVDLLENDINGVIETEKKSQRPLSYDDLSRRDARSLIFHLLYIAEAFDYQESLEAIVDNFNRGFNIHIPRDSKVFTVAQDIINNRALIDQAYQPLLTNWRIERVSVCTKLILHFGIWELLNTTTDQRIVINEAIELTKCFAEEGAYRFVNGILDRIAKERLAK
ncbi:MAG: transcription antitermination factor NusB [Candidatus Babeliales bacterium]